MADFIRRSRRASRMSSGNGTRLWLMVVLLGAVLLLMQFAKRPETWSAFSTTTDRENQEKPAGATVNYETNRPQSAPVDRRTPWTVGVLIVVGIVYMAWRIGPLRRFFARRADDTLDRWRRRAGKKNGDSRRSPFP